MGATDQMGFQHDYVSSSSSTTIGSESHSSESSTSSNSLELADDASSSSSSSSSTSITKFGNHGSMFELSDLMATLPIKVMSIEDLVKKEDPYYNSINRRKMLKASKSYANEFYASSKPYTATTTLHRSSNNRNKVSSFLINTPLLPCEQK
ncbi:hypothetical protein LINGRAHAP2_LOCUS7473 [Linum grandiflorum]